MQATWHKSKAFVNYSELLMNYGYIHLDLAERGRCRKPSSELVNTEKGWGCRKGVQQLTMQVFEINMEILMGLTSHAEVVQTKPEPSMFSVLTMYIVEYRH